MLNVDTEPRDGLARYAPILGVVGIVAIGALDFYSGTELRVTPLYFAPVAIMAWYAGRGGALLAAVLAAAAWDTANVLAGLEFSSRGIWVANTIMLMLSFAVVGLLIAQLRDAVIRETELSLTDPLTSMLNGRAFHKAADRIMAHCRRTGRPLTIAYVDLDNFKTVNDQLGHQAGDEMLRGLAKRMRSTIRPDDVGARLGGDEFVVLFPEISPADAAIALERLRSSLATVLGSGPIAVSSSAGAVTFLTVPDSIEEMLHAADSRMYAAKAAGKNRAIHDVVGMPPRQVQGADA
jgi:diguanylate cyclase (GGDEF)-like protein